MSRITRKGTKAQPRPWRLARKQTDCFLTIQLQITSQNNQTLPEPLAFVWLDAASNQMKGHWMLKKAGLLVAVLFFFTLSSLSQDKGHFDASFNGAVVLTHPSSGNGIQQSATIGSDYFGTFRFKFKPKHSLLFNMAAPGTLRFTRQALTSMC